MLWDVRKARNCLMSLDMGNLKGRPTAKSRRSREESIAHKGAVNGLAFSNTASEAGGGAAAGRHLVTLGCFDGRIRKWDITQGFNTKTAFPQISKVDVKLHVPIGNCILKKFEFPALF